jgi:hypothetical protein
MRQLTPQEEAVEAAVRAAKAGELGAPQQEGIPGEFKVLVTVNGEQTSYPLALLMVQNEQANALGRIADVLSSWRDQQSWYASERAENNKVVGNG